MPQCQCRPYTSFFINGAEFLLGPDAGSSGLLKAAAPYSSFWFANLALIIFIVYLLYPDSRRIIMDFGEILPRIVSSFYGHPTDGKMSKYRASKAKARQSISLSRLFSRIILIFVLILAFILVFIPHDVFSIDKTKESQTDRDELLFSGTALRHSPCENIAIAVSGQIGNDRAPKMRIVDFQPIQSDNAWNGNAYIGAFASGSLVNVDIYMTSQTVNVDLYTNVSRLVDIDGKPLTCTQSLSTIKRRE